MSIKKRGRKLTAMLEGLEALPQPVSLRSAEKTEDGRSRAEEAAAAQGCWLLANPTRISTAARLSTHAVDGSSTLTCGCSEWEFTGCYLGTPQSLGTRSPPWIYHLDFKVIV